MPALDRHHNAVRNALVKDGWIITHNPLTLTVGGRNVYVDIAAERLLTAEQNGRKIAVEVKTFGGASPVADLQDAIGQIALYDAVLMEAEPDRLLYLAVPILAYEAILTEPLGKLAQKSVLHRLLVFAPDSEEIIKWQPQP